MTKLKFIYVLFDNFDLAFRQVKSNYRTIMISSLGLIIALSMISSTLIFVETERYRFFSDYDPVGSFS